MQIKKARPVKRRTVDSRYPTTFAASSLSWTTTGTSATIESATNHTLWVPAVGQNVSFSLVLPAGYTAGSDLFPVVFHSHGQNSFPTTGNCYVSTIFPNAYHQAVSAGKVRAHITVFLCLGENSMGTNCPDGASLYESVMLAVHAHIHATYRTLGTTGRYNVLMGFSMGARASLYWLFKYATLYFEGRNPWRFGGACVFGAPVYAPDYDYASAGPLQDWARPCISPDGGYTAEEARIWETKCAQGYINLPALDGVKILLGYGGSDPVEPAAGADWNTLMNSEGVTHTYLDDLRHDDNSTFSHNKTDYWQGSGGAPADSNQNNINLFYEGVEEVFAAEAGGMPSSAGIFAVDGNSGHVTDSGIQTRSGNITDLPFVKGLAWRMPWRLFESTEGVYDWSALDYIVAQLDAIGQKLNWAIMPSEPEYVQAGAAATWSNPNTLFTAGGVPHTTAVPWDSFLQTRFAAFLNAAAAHEIYSIAHYGMVAFADHPVLVQLGGAVPGYGPLRETSADVEDIPGYTRALFKSAVMTQAAALRAAFPSRRNQFAMWQVDDGDTPVLWEDLQDSLYGVYGNTIGYFQDNMAASVVGSVVTGYPTTTYAAPLARMAPFTLNGHQALTSWLAPFTGPTKVAGGEPADGILYVMGVFNGACFEIYRADLENEDYWPRLIECAALLAAL